MRLENRVAIVTGGAGGIGAAISEALAAEGADVAIVVNRNWDGGRALARRIEGEYGRKPLVVRADVSRAGDVRGMVAQVNDHWGRIDILVNNAGIATVAKIETISEAEWDHVMAVNLKGHFLCCQAVIPYLKQQRRAKIVNMGSLNAKNGGTITGGVYASSKGAIHSFTFALARELAGCGICVNAVAPGPIDTEMIRAYPSEKVDAMVAHIPLGRVGTTQEVARAVVFLASSDADYITGEVIDINGGLWTD